MPCSCCHSSGHNIRTCKKVQYKIAEAVAMDYGSEFAISAVCAMIDAHFGGASVTQTAYELYKFAKACRSARGWDGMG